MPELTELEARLTRLGAELDWPVTPDLAPRIRSRIATQRPAPPRWFSKPWALAAAAVILALAALLAYAPARDTIAGWINVHALIERVQRLPAPSPHPPAPLGKRLGLGGQTTLKAAAGAVKWHVLVPASLGPPDEVYLQPSPDGPPQGEVTLVYSLRPGIPTSGQTGVAVLVTEARGAIDANFFGKLLGPGTTLEDVTAAGHPGYWIAGKPHVFFLVDAEGNIRDETLRLATNTLLFDDGGTVVRIEGDLTRAQALEIAASLH
ncbi:hypothetical protein EPN29_12410 [bacterium]|nr:MAG: hypothetical protein EPN29_12410 [bacterium]